MVAKKAADPMVWARMPEARFEQILGYMRAVADRLGLRDWTITVMRAPLDDDDDAAARIVPTYGRRQAKIWLAYVFNEWDAEEQRHVIVHELLHLTVEPLFARLSHTLPKVLGAPIYDLLMASIKLDAEYQNDALADFIAPLFPLIGDDWPEGL